MKKVGLIISILFVFSIVISACNLQASKPKPTTEVDLAYTAAALTVQASVRSATPDPAVVQPVEPTKEPESPAPPPQAVYTPAPVDSNAPCDRATFIDDITIPDNQTINPGASFTKTWLLRNEGTCTWTTGYAIVFSSGDQMSAQESVPLVAEVPPGHAVEISVNFVAPTENRTYRSNWMIRNEAGEIFGLDDYDDPFWAIIKVDAPPPPSFAVNAATFEMIPGSYNGVCPFPVTIKGKITVTGSGKVTYYYQREDGFRSDVMEINFESSGTKDLPDYSMTIGTGPGFTWTGNVWIYIDNPNHQKFNEQVFTVNCISP
jgi:hypothetical protein